MIHSVKKSYRGKKSKRSIKRTRKTRQRKLKGGVSFSTLLTQIQKFSMPANKLADMINNSMSQLTTLGTISQTTRYLILKHRERELSCRDRTWSSTFGITTSATNADLDEQSQAECKTIREEIDKIKASQKWNFGVARRFLRLNPINRVICSMWSLAFFHEAIYVDKVSGLFPIKRYLFLGCDATTAAKDEPTAEITIEQAEELNGYMRNTDSETITKLETLSKSVEIDEDSSNSEPFIATTQTDTTRDTLKEAQALYDEEGEKYPTCTNRLSVEQHKILLDYRIAQTQKITGGKFNNIIKGGFPCAQSDVALCCAVLAAGLLTAVGTWGTLVVVYAPLISIGGAGWWVCLLRK